MFGRDSEVVAAGRVGGPPGDDNVRIVILTIGTRLHLFKHCLVLVPTILQLL
jgi:hypothetical protein